MKHLLFDLETIHCSERIHSIKEVFKPEVDHDYDYDCVLKKMTVDEIDEIVNTKHPSVECCRRMLEEEIENKNRKGAIKVLNARIDSLGDPVPTKWKVAPELQRIITFGVGTMEEGSNDVWQFDGHGSLDDWTRRHLVAFWERYLELGILTCFNGISFDIPVLLMESKRLGVTCPHFKLHSFTGIEHNVLDVMRARYGREWKDLRTSALAAGLPLAEELRDELVSGANAARAFEEGRYDLIERHCDVDINRLRCLCNAYNGIFFFM